MTLKLFCDRYWIISISRHPHRPGFPYGAGGIAASNGKVYGRQILSSKKDERKKKDTTKLQETAAWSSSMWECMIQWKQGQQLLRPLHSMSLGSIWLILSGTGYLEFKMQKMMKHNYAKLCEKGVKIQDLRFEIYRLRMVNFALVHLFGQLKCQKFPGKSTQARCIWQSPPPHPTSVMFLTQDGNDGNVFVVSSSKYANPGLPSTKVQTFFETIKSVTINNNKNNDQQSNCTYFCDIHLQNFKNSS